MAVKLGALPPSVKAKALTAPRDISVKRKRRAAGASASGRIALTQAR